MLISLGITTAESVAVSLNQEAQCDSIWQTQFSHLNANPVASIMSCFLMKRSRAPVGGSVVLWEILMQTPLACTQSPTLMYLFIKCWVDFSVLAVVRFGSQPMAADRLTDEWMAKEYPNVKNDRNQYLLSSNGFREETRLSLSLSLCCLSLSLKYNFPLTSRDGEY